MPFKHNAARRHRIPRMCYKVTNWAAYEAGLRRRGDLTFWVDEAALAGWHAPQRSTPGGQPRYSDLAIELVLTLRLVFHLALRQEGFARSVLALLDLDLKVPDRTTLPRRGRAFAGRQPHGRPAPGRFTSCWTARVSSCSARASGARPSTAAGAGAGSSCTSAWTSPRARSPPIWRRTDDADDAAHAPALLRQVEGTITSLTADGAYDRDPVYQAAAARQPGSRPEVVIPPRADAALSTAALIKQTPRDRHIRLMAEQGRMGSQRGTGYGRRNYAETTMSHYKHLIGPRVRARICGAKPVSVPR